VLDSNSVNRLGRRFELNQLATISPRFRRGGREDDSIMAWRLTPVAAFFRLIDPLQAPDRTDTRFCGDCSYPAVYTISRRA
jgi:hypothetical protein